MRFAAISVSNTWFHPRSQCLDMQLECFNTCTENSNLQWFCQDCKQSLSKISFRNSCAVSAPSRLTRKGLLTIYSVVDVLNYDDSKMIPAIQTLPRVKRPTYYHPSTTASQFIRKLKLPEIRKLLQNSSLDILAVAETKLANAITDGEIGIEGYFAIRKGRHSNSRYVLMCYKDSSAVYEELKMQIPHAI